MVWTKTQHTQWQSHHQYALYIYQRIGVAGFSHCKNTMT